MRKLITLIALLAVASVALAGTLTNRQWETDGVDTNTMRGGVWSRYYNDQSQYASQDDRFFTVVRFYDSSLHGTTSPVKLEKLYKGEVPTLNNYVLLGGCIQVVEPNAGTNAYIGLEADADVKAAGNWLATTGIKALEVTGAASAIGPASGTNDFRFGYGTGSTITNAMFMIITSGYLMQ